MSDKKTDAAMKEKIVRCDDEVSLADISKMVDKVHDEAFEKAQKKLDDEFEKAYSSAVKERKTARGEILDDLIIENAFVIQDENGVTRECTQEEYDRVQQYLSNLPRSSSVRQIDAALAYANAVTKPLTLTKKEMKKMIEEGEAATTDATDPELFSEEFVNFMKEKKGALAEEANAVWEGAFTEEEARDNSLGKGITTEQLDNELSKLQQKADDIMQKKGFKKVKTLESGVSMFAKNEEDQCKERFNQRLANDICNKSMGDIDNFLEEKKGDEITEGGFMLEKLDKKINNLCEKIDKLIAGIQAEFYLREEDLSNINNKLAGLLLEMEKLTNADKKIRTTRKKRTNSVRKVGRPHGNAKKAKKEHRKLLVSHTERRKSPPARSNKLKKTGRKSGRS